MFFLLFLPPPLPSTRSFPRALIPQIQALRQRKVLERQTPPNAWQILRAVSQCDCDLTICLNGSFPCNYIKWDWAFQASESQLLVLKGPSLFPSSICDVSVESSTLDVFDAPVTSSAPRPPQSPRRPQHPLPPRLNILAQPAQELGPPAQVQVCVKVCTAWQTFFLMVCCC